MSLLLLYSGGGAILSASVAFAGHGTVSPTAAVKRAASVTYVAHGTASDSASLLKSASVTISAHGTLTVTASALRGASLATTGHGTLTGTARALRPASLTTLGTGTFDSTATTQLAGAVDYASAATVSATPQGVLVPLDASVSFGAVATFAATWSEVAPVAPRRGGGGYMLARRHRGQASFAGGATFSASPTLRRVFTHAGAVGFQAGALASFTPTRLLAPVLPEPPSLAPVVDAPSVPVMALPVVVHAAQAGFTSRGRFTVAGALVPPPHDDFTDEPDMDLETVAILFAVTRFRR